MEIEDRNHDIMENERIQILKSIKEGKINEGLEILQNLMPDLVNENKLIKTMVIS